MPRKWAKHLELAESGTLTASAMAFIGTINRSPKLRRKYKIKISKDLQRYKIYKIKWRKK